MTVWRYVLRRVAAALLLIAVVSSAALLLTIAVANRSAAEGQSPEERARSRTELGLDQPILTQYIRWIARAVRFDFGDSILYRRPVNELLRERATNTATLATAVILTTTIIGIPLGIYTGLRGRHTAARIVRGLSLILVSTPPLVTSQAHVTIAGRTGWPVGGKTSPGSAWEPFTVPWMLDVAQHLVLPTLALALPLAAILERLQSDALASNANTLFVKAALVRGLSFDQARLRHAWRGSLGAVLGLYGVIVGSLLSGSFIVEFVTAWPGLGRLMYDALLARDLFLVAGTAAAGAFFLALGTLVSDLLHAAADPRVLVEGRS
jgi:peptide/nickel transport system permease protein